jgi:NADPH:quinone reductase-like Zn-dependent oxidoreductase
MRAVVITGAGGPEVLELRDVPRPEPGTEQVLVRVRASALNRADLLQRQGRYPAPPGAPADIPGIEFAGEVAGAGPGARLWREGDGVFGLVGGGAHAEYLVAHERAIAPVPPGAEWGAAAATPEAFITAHDALVAQASVRPAERVLIHAVGSGVGLAAVQLARALGAVPYGTARTPSKLLRARDHGLEDGWLATADLRGLRERVDGWTAGRGMDVVLDLAGGPYVAASAAALGLKGRLILIGAVAGGGAQLPLGHVMSSRITIRGTVLRSRPLEERILTTRAFAAEVVPMLGRGLVAPVVDSRYPLAEIAAAHSRLEGNATFGKVVVDVAP